MMTENITSDLAIPPGEYLEEVLDELGMTKDELARRMGRPASKLSQIFSGNKRITEETALQLETVLGVPAHIWTGLESEYRLTLARNENPDFEELKREITMVRDFCYPHLVALGEVPDTRKPRERVLALRRYFGVTSLKLVTTFHRYQAAFRCAGSISRSPEAMAAWLRLGERRTQNVSTPGFDRKKLLRTLPQLRQLTFKNSGNFEAELRGLLAECGIALVICPHFPKTGAHGATFTMAGKAVLMITVRGAWADIFWFTLFHELGHILFHGNMLMIEGCVANEQETQADEFARDTLVPPKEYQTFIARGDFSRNQVNRFSQKITIHPGIVVGRLHHDKIIPQSWLNDLRIRLNS